MPKKPKRIHPLRSLRETLGKTQGRFAKMVGVSESYIQAIELGQRQISDDLALDIAANYGLNPEWLKGKAKVFNNGCATLRESCQTIGDTLSRSFRDDVEFFVDSIEAKVEILLAAAQRERKEIAVLLSLQKWIDDATKRYGLGTTIKAVLNSQSAEKNRKSRASWETRMITWSKSNPGCVRITFGPRVAQFLVREDNPWFEAFPRDQVEKLLRSVRDEPPPSITVAFQVFEPSKSSQQPSRPHKQKAKAASSAPRR
jgi:transcriptional regulator with XRE-family HTH domain